MFKSTTSEASSEGQPRKQLRTEEEPLTPKSTGSAQGSDDYYEQLHSQDDDQQWTKILSTTKESGQRVLDHAVKPLQYLYSGHLQNAFLSWKDDHLEIAESDIHLHAPQER